MIDTHAHLDFPQYDQDRDEVIRRAFGNGIKAIINVGVDLERSRKSIELAEQYENVYASVGLHPDWFSKAEEYPISNIQYPKKYQIPNPKIETLINELTKLAKNKKVVAIGECGLDYFRIGKSEEIREKQKKGFLAQIEVAKELELPVIVHCREVYPVASDDPSKRFGAWEDVYEIISNIQYPISNKNPKSKIQKNKKILNTKYQILDTKFVLHCYSGNAKDTEKFLKLSNVFFSFSGNITFPKPEGRADQLAEAIRMIPLDRLMLDSDAPYLAPQEFRGKRNEPAHIRYIAEKIGEIKNIGFPEVEKVTNETARKFFGL